MPSILQDDQSPSLPDKPSVLKPPVPPKPATPAAPAPVAAAPSMRPFGDADATRTSIYDNVLKAAQGIQPVSNTRYSMELADVGWADPDKVSIADQKRAILEGTSLQRRLRGTWVLKDPAGTPIDSKTSTIAHVPHLTQRGTFVLNGTEYTLSHQMRLRSGIYHRQRENGELEAHVNVLPGKGLSHRYRMEPETGVFKVDIGQASLPLLPVLKALGATDKEIRDHWGPELHATNMAKDDPKVIDKLYARLVRKPDPQASAADKQKALADELMKMELDPEVTQRTLGQPYKNLSKEAVLASTKKLLAISRQETEHDDRDHLAFQHFMGPEDLIAERLGRDRTAINQLLWKATYKGNLQSMPAGALTKNVHAAIMKSGLGMPLEEINPSDVFDQQTRVSRLGYGGIPSMDAVPDESRNVQPSHLGYVDLLRTPECHDADTEVLTWTGWRKWPDVTPADSLACLVGDRLEFHRPLNLTYQDYDGPLYGAKSATIEYLVTPGHRLYVRPMHDGAAWRIETPQEVGTKSRIHRTGGHQPWVGDCPYGSFTLPAVERLSNNTNTVPPIPMRDWAEFMGWFLSEGHFTVIPAKGYYVTGISQSQSANPLNCRRIESLLARLPFKASYNRSMKSYILSGKQLATYCSQFGFCHQKWIPAELLAADVDSRKVLYDALLLGDGRKNKKGERYQFCSTSRRLAEDFQLLAFSLGVPSRITVETDKRKESYLPCYVVNLHDRVEREVHQRNRFQVHYTGKVYCAEVPGGLLYVRRGETAGHWSGNSFKVGVDSRVSYMAKKGTDGKVYTPFHDPKTGQVVYKSPQEVADLTVAFPNEMQGNKPMVAAMVGGKTRMVPREQVDLALPHMEHAFSPVTNLVPLKSTIKGQRVAMGSRFITQALPLANAESPYVRSMVPGMPGRSFEEHYGKHMGVAHAKDVGGRVAKVTPDAITVKYADGTTEEHEIYNTFPYNRKTFLHSTPLVKEGDPIQPGQLLAKSNYTDDKGAMALGMNTRIAYMPYKGLNYEDAFAISESMAKRLSSEHMYQHSHEWDEKTQKGKMAYATLFPTKYDKKMLEKLDDKGVIKPGTVVEPGDPLVLAAVARDITHKQVHSSHKGSFADRSITWDHHSPGVVTDVAHTPKGVTVAVKSLNPTQVGDKISGRYGDKGVISAVIPDHEMPHDSQGRPYEVLANPLGVISRTNPGQVVEAALGKIAEKTGKPYIVEDFNHEINDVSEWAKKQLEQHGLSDMEDVTDPTTGRTTKILTGNRFMMKLHHTSECFDAKTEALTSRGWVPWPDVEPSDQLATVRDNQLVFETPTRLMRYQYSGDLYCYEGRYLDYAVTPNHRLYVSFYHRKDRSFSFESAADVHGRRCRVPQFGFPQLAFGCDAGPDTVINVAGLSMTAGDYAELVGWWASEGYAQVTHRRACVVLYQSREANPEKFAQIERLVERLGLPWHHFRSKGTDLGVVISSRPLATYLRKHGTHSPNKRLPRELLNHAPETLRRAYDAMMAGDGSTQQTPTGPNARYTTVSKGLADDFQELCIRMGLGAVVRRGTERAEMLIQLPDGRRYTSSCLPVWECGIALKRTVAQVDGDRNGGGFSRREYYGVVYCAEMSTGLLYVRRNGKPMLSGNSKGQGRGLGAYTAEDTPARGGEAGSKRLALMDVNALLSHGATEVLRDGKMIRGQKNQEYWTTFMSGFRPPSPKVPFVYHKFINQLKASGINVVRKGTQQHLMALTNKDIDQMTGDREIKNTETVDWKNGLRPVPGGLFDVSLTGGHTGNRWAHIKLHEPMPNPAFEEPIRRMLGLTGKKFEEILAGQEKLKGQTGPKAIYNALASMNVPRELAQARADIASGRKTLRDDAVRRLGYLKACEKQGLEPKDWMLDKVPVIPPVFRPVSVMQNTGGQLVNDANYLYKELFDANQVLKDSQDKLDDTSAERLNVYNAFKAVVGLGDPIQPKSQEKQIKGMLKQVFGSSSKFGTVQQKLLGSSVDLVGRAVVTPNPDLNMDEVGLPENRAWEVYTPFIVRRLVRRGVGRLQALQYVKDRHDLARRAMLEEMDDRPVLVNRAPVLHRYGMLAFKPRLTKGDVLQVSPIVVGGFNMDFDGDASNYQVPAEDSARDEAMQKMMPSHNLIAVSSLKQPMYQPRQEYVGGLWAATATKNPTKRPRVFATTQDAVRAYHHGELDPGDPVHILDHEGK